MKKLLFLPGRWGALLALVVLSVFLASGVARASEPVDMQLSVPQQTRIGDEIEAAATLTEPDGKPLMGVEVTFYLPVVFANVSDEVEIGRSTTDEQGMATIPYAPRQWGENLVVARFDGDDDHAPAAASATLLVAPGPQLYSEEAGVKIPGLGVWVLAVALAVVWGLLAAIVGLLFLIAARSQQVLPYVRGKGFR